MEHNTDRILWTVLILAIGVSLYVIFRPAMSSQTQAVVQTISDLNGVDSSSHSDFTYSAPNTTDDTISITGYKGHEEILIIPEYRKIGSIDYKITAISHNAFYENTSIKQVTIPDSVTSIADNAFRHDYNLKYVTLGSDVTSIGNWAFQNDYALTRINFPASLTSIGNWAFQNTALTSVDVPNSLTSIGDSAFYNAYNLKSLTLGSGVTSIGQYAFYGTALTKVDFPASLKSIGDYAFNNTSMSDISFKKPVNLGVDTFSSTKLTNVTLPTGSTYHTDANNQTFDANVKVTFN